MGKRREIDRRELLGTFGAATAGGTAFSFLSKRLAQAQSSAASGISRHDQAAGAATSWTAPPDLPNPNILIIMVDQMRWPMWLNSSQIATLTQVYLPNIIGRLRNSSYVFQQYYAAATVCSAARSTFLTGLYAPQTAVYEDSRSSTPDLLAAFPTWAKALAVLNPAYQDNVWWFGKWHLSPCSTSAPLQPFGFNTRTYPGGPDTNPSPNGYPNEGTNGGVCNGSTYANDAMIAADFISWLQEQPPPGGGPPVRWCSTVSLINPHDIAGAPPWLQGDPFPPPGSCAKIYFTPPVFGPPFGPPPLYASTPSRWNYENLQEVSNKPALQCKFQSNSNRSGEPDWVSFLNHYYWLQHYVDQQIGLILNALSASPFAANTIVIFTSDHGEYAGSHGIHNKGYAAYDESIRVPLYVKFPGQKPGVTMNQMCSSVDCFGLICDLATGGIGTWRQSFPDLAYRQSIWSFLYNNSSESRIAPALGIPYIFHTCDDTRQASAVSKAHIVCLRTKFNANNANQPGAKLAVYSEWPEGATIPDGTPPEFEFYDYNPRTTNNRSETGNDYFAPNQGTKTTIAQYLSVLGGWDTLDSGLIQTELNAPLLGLGTDGNPLSQAQAAARQNYLDTVGSGGGGCGE